MNLLNKLILNIIKVFYILSLIIFDRSRLDQFYKNKMTNDDLFYLNLWKSNLFSVPHPQFMKNAIFEQNTLPDCIWIETGTYLGEGAEFLASISKKVITIEPSEDYFKGAKKRLNSVKNIDFVNGTSEEKLEEIIQEIETKNLCFWLDGHFSGGDTFLGENWAPILYELDIIGKHLSHFDNVNILIDDIRLCNPDSHEGEHYPDKNEIVDWCKNNNLSWEIHSDIFIAKKVTIKP
jgi:hypothetical protein